eukprot:5026992-Alexandrium_andersonii.AAC.1
MPHVAEGLELLLRPAQDAANMREIAQQVTACLGLPKAAPLGLGLQAHGRGRVGPHADCLLYTSPSPRD